MSSGLGTSYRVVLFLLNLVVNGLLTACTPTIPLSTPPENYKEPLAERPVLQQGDYWVYERGNLTRVKTTTLPTNIGFPLWIGKTWSYYSEALPLGHSQTSIRVPARIDCYAVAFKQVVVAAGAFGAFECECRCTATDPAWDPWCGSWTIWYAPEVKNIIGTKTESTATSMELVDYRASGPAPSAKVAPGKASEKVGQRPVEAASSQAKFEANPESTQRALLRGEIKEALASYESQATDAEKNAAASLSPREHWRTASNAYVQASRAARFLGELQKSITYGNKAFEAATNAKAPRDQVNAILTLISSYSSVRNLEKAREWLNRGFEIVKEIPPNTNTRISWEGVLYEQLGLDLARRGEYEKAIDVYPRAIRLYEDWLSNLYRQEKRNEGVIERARRDIISSLNLLGFAYLRTGKLQQAMEQYGRAFKSISEWGLPYAFEDDLHRNIGEIHVRRKNFSLALDSFQKALAFAEKQERPEGIRMASGRIGDILLQQRKPAEAIRYFQTAIQQIESVRSLLRSEEFRGSYFEGSLGAYVQMVRALVSVGKREEAFNFTERARSRVFLDVLGSKVQLARSGTLMEHERALQARISVLRAILEREGTDSSEVPDLRKQLSEAQQAYNEYLTKVRKENKEQASLMNVEPLTLKQVQDLLDPSVTMLEYFVTGDRVWLWVVDRGQVQFVSTSIQRKDLVSKVTLLRDAIYQLGEKEKFNGLSQELYRLLIQPALQHMRGKELIIVPHDVLHYVPFHALLSPEGKYLIEKYPIYYLSSASLLQFTTEKRRAKGDLSAVLAQAGKVLAMGNPDLGDPKMNLQFAEMEAKEIQTLYPQSTVLLKKEATKEKAKALSPQNDIMHFATHAELNEDDPLSSAILLAKSDKEDGRLEVREIFGMDLHANLVVLSACETGLGKLSTGDELVGLTRAFIYAGTPSVVASLWNVEDSSTAALMASFYKNLKSMSKVEALRQAQLELIRGQASSDLLARRGIGGIGKLGETPSSALPAPSSEPDAPNSVSTSHPYFWAPFILVGDGK